MIPINICVTFTRFVSNQYIIPVISAGNRHGIMVSNVDCKEVIALPEPKLIGTFTTTIVAIIDPSVINPRIPVKLITRSMSPDFCNLSNNAVPNS